MRTMVLAYLPTTRGDAVRANVGVYSIHGHRGAYGILHPTLSQMLHVWNINPYIHRKHDPIRQIFQHHGASGYGNLICRIPDTVLSWYESG